MLDKLADCGRKEVVGVKRGGSFCKAAARQILTKSPAAPPSFPKSFLFSFSDFLNIPCYLAALPKMPPTTQMVYQRLQKYVVHEKLKAKLEEKCKDREFEIEVGRFGYLSCFAALSEA